MIEINFTQEEEDLVLEIAASLAAAKSIDPEQAIKQLLIMGVNAWKEMEFWVGKKVF